MKKKIKNNIQIIIGIIIGIIYSSITVYAAYQYQAFEVSYTPSDETWNVNNVEEALRDLYSKGVNSEEILVGSGDVSYKSNSTERKLIPATLEQEGYLSLENDKFTVQKEGYYIILSAVGSNNRSGDNTLYSGFTSIYINDEEKSNIAQGWDTYETAYMIEKLNIGDTISGYYYGNGGLFFTKRSEYKILYIG